MIVLDAAALVLAQALMGAGAQRTVMLLTLGMQWLLFCRWPGGWAFGLAMALSVYGCRSSFTGFSTPAAFCGYGSDAAG